MDFEALYAIFDGFELENFLPELDSLLGWVETLLRIAVMAGPLMLLGFGLVYLLAPPKEANHSAGYRFWWGMASLEAWQFTQRTAGIGWTALGTVLTIVMAVLCNGFRGMEAMDMAWLAVKCIGWQIGLTVLCCLTIDVLVIIAFDRYGYRRGSYDEYE